MHFFQKTLHAKFALIGIDLNETNTLFNKLKRKREKLIKERAQIWG